MSQAIAPGTSGAVPLILIVEDRERTAEQIYRQIEGSGDMAVAPPARGVAEGLEALARLRPRVVLTDMGLPDGSGLEIVRAVAAADWDCESIVISVIGEEQQVVDAIRLGARGYVLKFEALDRTAEVVRTVLAGGSPVSPQVARHLLALVERAPGTRPEGEVPDLTRRELEILRLVSRGYKREEVAGRLGISVSTVGTHINAIYRKLEVRSNIEAVTIAARLGLL
ncbi:response regulator transcription factor [Marivita sp. GX14005]|uniref:LuxR C-terminal-related transcriptional regulator n=1 Tax=Marivita sp. GX14005 TaxID=2942276 RepID=UPI00201948B1|nr:response regulator transcription factor [Marivita sp. GX14005]MCL3883283.1 response regulator transcription factor [Marivita sp. GX14005]